MKVKFLIGAFAAAMLLSACGNKGGDTATETTPPPAETAPQPEATPPADQTTPPPADQTTPPEQTPPPAEQKSNG